MYTVQESVDNVPFQVQKMHDPTINNYIKSMKDPELEHKPKSG
jgi:hypothetical protein